MNRKILAIVLVLAAFGAGLLLGPRLPMTGPDSGAAGPEGAPAEKEILYWVAPMDPNFRRDGPGKSPMGMDLVPVEIEADDTRFTVDAVWVCPDHPDVIRESGPGECTIDGQPLVREASADHEGHANRQGAVVRLEPSCGIGGRRRHHDRARAGRAHAHVVGRRSEPAGGRRG